MQRAKYQLIKDELIQEIKSGLFQPGQKFHSESELKARYQVSSATVIRAIQELVNEEYVVRYQGKGSFVSKAKRDEKIIFSETDNQLVGIQSVKMLAHTLEQHPIILSKLKLNEQQRYHRIVRQRFNNKKPFAIQVTHINEQFLHADTEINTKCVDSLYQLLKEKSGLDMYTMPYIQTIDIVQDISTDFANYLQLAHREPVVLMKRITYDNHKNVIEYVETYKLTEAFHLEIRNTEKEPYD